MTTCPPGQSLRQYAIGDIDDALGEEIERHLAECPACDDTVAQFDSADDTLMRHLPLAAAAGVEATAESPGWLAQLRDELPASRVVLDPERGGGPPGSLEPSVASDAFSAYELLGILGRGGMGVVYRARHRQLGRDVALKVLRPQLMAAAEARRRFEREIQVLGGLHHPGIVMATDAGRIGDAAYLVMELIDGVDLARLVRRGGPLTIAEACEAVRQMAVALAAAHEAGTVHRDVKPSNAMVDRQGRVKLLDFGLAHLHVLSAESLETSLGRLLGTLDYMAPEQADSEQTLDARVDLYGLGATLFYLLTGRPPHGPHTGRSLVEQLRALTAAKAPRVSTLRADVPPELDAFIARLLARDPEARPASAAAVADELSQWAGDDLAARVADTSPLPPVVDSTWRGGAGGGKSDDSDSEAALHSLSELVGLNHIADPSWVGSPHITDPSWVGPTAPNKRNALRGASHPAKMAGLFGGRRRRWLIATAAAFAAIACGIVILLKTPEGTLRIESEVDNVQVTLVDEQNATREWTVERGPNETKLRAGRYVIRFAGQYDGLGLKADPNEITLKRGQETVARIIREPAEGDPENLGGFGGPSFAQSMRRLGGESIADRIYKGKAESEWQRVFMSEIDPAARLEALKALLNLAAQKPVQEQIQQILGIGEELVRSDFPSNSFASVLSLYEFQSLDPYLALGNQLQTLPMPELAAELCDAAVKGSDARASFALSILAHFVDPEIHKDPNAAKIILRELDVPLTGLNRSAACLIVRTMFASHANITDQQELTELVGDLAIKLRNAAPSPVNNQWIEAVLGAAGVRDDWPVKLQLAFSELALKGIIARRPGVIHWFNVDLVFSGIPGTIAPYDAEYVSKAREYFGPHLNKWLFVANPYLREHREPPFDDATRDVVKSLEKALIVYSDGDDWPVDETAAILTEQLRRYYTDDPNATTADSVEKLLPASPAQILTQIVRVTGQIPDFVKSGHPRPAAVNDRVKEFADFVTGETGPLPPERANALFGGLYDEAPLDVIRSSLAENKALRPLVEGRPSSSPRFALGLASAGTRVTATEPGTTATWKPDSIVDPLLLLAALADAAGASERQDAQIAQLLLETETGFSVPKWYGMGGVAAPAKDPREVGLRVHLQNLLASPLKARHHARRMLAAMATKAKSPALIDAIKEIDPTVAGTEQPQENAAGAEK